MTAETDTSEPIDNLLATPDLAEALASDRFKQFLDHIPVAILVSEIAGEGERIVYANHEAEDALGMTAEAICGASWAALDARWSGDDGVGLGTAIGQGREPVGVFGGPPDSRATDRLLEAQASLIVDDEGVERFRLVALVDVSLADREALEAQLRDKDLQLQEIQHRVKNNLQMITALIRMEARRAGGQIGDGAFDRLAGRIEALGLLYNQLSAESAVGAVDLGSFLSQIAGAVMKSHATDGVRLNLQVDVVATTVDVAMPLGLLVNELMTNALKYAFAGREEGTVALRCLKDADNLCTVSVADDGVGMPPDARWPRPGKLGALIVRSLEENAKAKVEASSKPGEGVTTLIRFKVAPPPVG